MPHSQSLIFSFMMIRFIMIKWSVDLPKQRSILLKIIAACVRHLVFAIINFIKFCIFNFLVSSTKDRMLIFFFFFWKIAEITGNYLMLYRFIFFFSYLASVSLSYMSAFYIHFFFHSYSFNELYFDVERIKSA